MKSKTYFGLIAALALFCLVISAIIEVEKLRAPASLEGVCVATGSNCTSVQQSIYGKTFGIDNAWFGIVGFFVLFVLAILQYQKNTNYRRMIIVAATFIAGIAAIWFLYIQQFILQQYCTYCIVVDIASIILLVLGFLILLHKK